MNQADELKERTKRFAIRVVKLFRSLPKTEDARVIGRQLLRSSTSVAANYRAACRARSRADFVSKMGIVVEESDETVFWLELVTETNLVPRARIENLLAEANQLLAIFAASQRTAKALSRSQRESNRQ